jgi:hypothetical protein
VAELGMHATSLNGQGRTGVYAAVPKLSGCGSVDAACCATLARVHPCRIEVTDVDAALG